MQEGQNMHFIRKGGYVAPSEVQIHFCTISGKQDISKTYWVSAIIRFQEFEIMNNRISLNLIPL